jgi:NAD(P)-dependent dehydrogenase (short-subunit alcohol dehydrogenase family)
MPQPRVVLVTGASSGFGKETSALLSRHGFSVFGTSRKPSPGDVRIGVEMLQLDVDSDDSVRDSVNAVMDKTGRLDILVNNAGFVLTGGIEETSVSEAKAQFETNFFGAARMVNAVLPVMRKQGSGQIINVSSILAWLPIPFEGYYSAAKAALLAYSEALRYEVKNFGVKVSVVEPGFFNTNLVSARHKPSLAIGDYDEMRTKAVKVFDEETEKGGDPKRLAETVLRIIESKSPQFEYLVGKSGRYRTLKHVLPQSVMENALRKRWKLD